ncbi:MAG: RHS repeat-associated core domain-containing protein [Verrucomicrobiales bacterium]
MNDFKDGPWANDTVAYLHDTMGRMNRREIRNDDQSVSSFVEHDFDILGRVETTTDNLGVHEVTAFDGDTARPLGIESKLSAAGATVVERTYAYTDTNSGKRLASIANETGADALLSTFAYSYSPTGQITDWTRNLAGQGTTTWKIDYDPLYQLKDVTVTDGSGTEVDRYAYHYDAAGNRTGEAIGTAGAFASHNVRNQKTQVGGDGTTLIEGTVDEPSSVTVDGEPVAVRALPGGSEYLYQKEVSMTQGPNTFEIVAEDGSGNTENKTYSVEVSGANKILAYDANGNMLSETDQSNGIVKRYEWDAMNRLLAVQSHDPPQAGAQRVEYRYDGLGRRVGRTVKSWSVSSWAVSQDNSYLWCGTEMCQKRDSSGGQIVSNYSGFGTERIVAGVSEKRWFTRDHLGSVREMVDETGAVKARYDYDPWGRRSKLEGSEDVEFGFTGHFYDEAADLHLTLFRAYDADLGRWLSADPIGEAGGINLYEYAHNDPINFLDPLGLTCNKYKKQIAEYTSQIEAIKRKRATNQKKLQRTLTQLINDDNDLRNGPDGIGPQSPNTRNSDSFDYHRRRRGPLRDTIAKQTAAIERLEKLRDKATSKLAACEAAEKKAKRKAAAKGAAKLGGRGIAPIGAAITGWEIGELITSIPTGDGRNVGDEIFDWFD